eukprot:TRINITY_DN5836_c0_g1_i2.p2 TRINITY_DN5836_c0_g1~~TRINITY_DN5836_c0_g1_i2.p2  ORF type:complete len:137 (-),score=13.17 TRINITY_DN5836_c0_g1_i2:376-786(-)
MLRRPPRSTLSSSSAASDVYKRQEWNRAGANVVASPRCVLLAVPSATTMAAAQNTVVIGIIVLANALPDGTNTSNLRLVSPGPDPLQDQGWLGASSKAARDQEGLSRPRVSLTRSTRWTLHIQTQDLQSELLPRRR